jgi:hypothetical protein
VITRFGGLSRVIVVPIIHGLFAKAEWGHGFENAKADCPLRLAVRVP